MRLLLGQEESAGQTYARVVDTPELAFGGDINVRGGAIKVTNTDSYNESSIFYGEEDENWGILDSDVSYGFGLNELGTASGTETFDDESDTYDQDITFSNGGLTYDQGSGGNLILPSFDKTDQYDINFADTVVSQDWGVLGISSAGGPAYDQHLYPYNTGFVSQEINNGYHDYGWVNEEIPIPTRYPYGSVYWTQPVPRAKTMWIPKWNGSGTLIVQGSGDERVAVASSTTTLFDFVGTTSPERYIAQTPENTVLYDTSGTLKESLTKDFVGSGSIALTQTQAVGFTTYRRVIFPPASGQYTLSGTVTEKWSGDPPEGTYLHIFGGAYTDLKLTYATQSTKAVMRLSGELNHPDIDYTPHYGIDRNIGIETGLTLLPGGGTDRITGITTAVYVPKYPGGQSLLDGKGGKTHEVITIDGRSISRTNAPISTHGVIYILGIGTAGNGVGGPEEKGDLDGVEFGATWRFTPATEYGIGSIMFDFTGGAESREINVYGYYGDDKDPGASGQITIRQEGGIYTLEKITKIYETVADGTGAYTYEGGATGEARTFSEVGSGSLYSIGGASLRECCMHAAELVAGTSIFNGTAEESFTARDMVPWYQAPTVLTLSGTAKAQRRFERLLVLEHLLSATTSILLLESDLLQLDLVLSLDLVLVQRQFHSKDLQVLFLSISLERQIQDGSQSSKTSLHLDLLQFLGNFPIHLSTSLQQKLVVDSQHSSDRQKQLLLHRERLVLVHLQHLVLQFQDLQVRSGEGTILYDLKGEASAITKLHWLYSPTTSGVTTLSGLGDTREIQTYGYYGDDKDPGTSGTFTFSNTPLVHPFVDYTPSIGIGSAVLYSVYGGSTERRSLGSSLRNRILQKTCQC